MTWPAYPPPHADAHGYDRVMDDRAVADPYAGWDDEDETSETAAPQQRDGL